MFAHAVFALVAIQSSGLAASSTDPAFEEGERLLRAGEASDLFVNESAQMPGAILLRHKASGFVCVMNPGKPLNAITVFPSAIRGDDVGCTTETITDIRTLYLTRTNVPVERLAESAAAAIRARYRDPRPVNLTANPSMFAPSELTIPPHISIGFETSESYEQVTVGIIGGWAVKYRFSAAPGRSGVSGILESFWTTTAVLEPELAARRAARQSSSSAPAAVPPQSPSTPAD